MTKILVCGFGSIGQKHARHLKAQRCEIKVWRRRADQSAEITVQGCDHESSLDAGLSWCDAVVIATATDEHVALAMQAATQRKPFYLEKPVSHNIEGLAQLRTAAEGLVVEVGCQMRRHPNLQALHKHLQAGEDGPVLAFQAWVGQRLDQWRPGTDYRESYSADVSRGGGALFDLVHEIDLMTWFAGPMMQVSADLRQVSDLEMKAEDLANVLLVSRAGAAGTVQMDMLSPAYRRGLQVVCAKAVFKWDMLEGKLWRDNGQGAVCIDEIPANYKPAQMIEEALGYFLHRVKNPALPASCSLAEGIHDVEILIAAREADRTGQRQSLEVCESLKGRAA